MCSYQFWWTRLWITGLFGDDSQEIKVTPKTNCVNVLHTRFDILESSKICANIAVANTFKFEIAVNTDASTRCNDGYEIKFTTKYTNAGTSIGVAVFTTLLKTCVFSPFKLLTSIFRYFMKIENASFINSFAHKTTFFEKSNCKIPTAYLLASMEKVFSKVNATKKRAANCLLLLLLLLLLLFWAVVFSSFIVRTRIVIGIDRTRARCWLREEEEERSVNPRLCFWRDFKSCQLRTQEKDEKCGKKILLRRHGYVRGAKTTTKL